MHNSLINNHNFMLKEFFVAFFSLRGILEAWFTYATIILSLVATAFKCIRAYRSIQPSLSQESYTTQNGFQENTSNASSQRSITSVVVEDAHIALLMLVTLILRPHNSAVVAILTLLQYGIHGYLLPGLRWKVWVVTLLHVWMGQAAFYAQVKSVYLY